MVPWRSMTLIDMSQRPPKERLEPVARAGLGSLLAISSLDGPPSDRALATIRAVAERLLKVNLDLNSLSPTTPEQLAEAVPEMQWRQRIIRGMTVIALLDDDPSEKQLAFLEDTASALGLEAAPVRTFRNVVRDRLTLVRLDVARRSFIGPAAAAYLKNEGPRGALGLARQLLGKEDPETAARYHTLDTYPEATFGRAYADFIAMNRFSYPGEEGGPPPPVMRHDCCHVLGGYGTTAGEECAVVAFQAGFQKEDPFFVMLFTLAQFELGIAVTPFLPGADLEIPPDLILAGLEHGTHVSRDLIGDASWDPWDHFARPIDEVRSELSVPPRGREPVYLQYDEEGNVILSA